MTWPGTPGYVCTGESLTIQGDTIPMSKILLRFASGIASPHGNALFGDVEDDEHESDDYNVVTNADLVEKQKMLEDRIAFLEVIKEKKRQATDKKNEEAKTASEAT